MEDKIFSQIMNHRPASQVGRRPSVIPEEGFMISRSPSIIAADEDDLDDNEFFDAMETAGDGPAQVCGMPRVSAITINPHTPGRFSSPDV
jgi:hypothetical protein